jgi:hypothetical protein
LGVGFSEAKASNTYFLRCAGRHVIPVTCVTNWASTVRWWCVQSSRFISCISQVMRQQTLALAFHSVLTVSLESHQPTQRLYYSGRLQICCGSISQQPSARCQMGIRTNCLSSSGSQTSLVHSLSFSYPLSLSSSLPFPLLARPKAPSCRRRQQGTLAHTSTAMAD